MLILSLGSRTVTPYNDSSYDPVELGASIFAGANKVGSLLSCRITHSHKDNRTWSKLSEISTTISLIA